MRATKPFLQARGLDIRTTSGRPLFHQLDLILATDRVAMVGRNGVGKSTLLKVLAGEISPHHGVVRWSQRPWMVAQTLGHSEHIQLATWLRAHPRHSAQLLDEASTLGLVHVARRVVDTCFLPANPRTVARQTLQPAASLGELRKLHLLAAKIANPHMLLLDEPTSDLDADGASWLRGWLKTWPNGLIVISHDRDLLRTFGDFLVVAESGCHHHHGSYAELRAQLAADQREEEVRYLRALQRLEQQEQKHDRICQRRKRKKNVGRLHELRRRTSRARLNDKRSYAQQSQARVAKIRDQRITAARELTRAARRALMVSLPLHVNPPSLPPSNGPVVRLKQITAVVETATEPPAKRVLFSQLNLDLGRERLALIGPNGAGKTTLLDIILDNRKPCQGVAWTAFSKVGTIAQGGRDWLLPHSLLQLLRETADVPDLDSAVEILHAHQFPLALGKRPLHSLSPGERVRAALICLFARRPALDLLVLDEPTYSLDLVGLNALTTALQAWPGGLLVASHDAEFLRDIGVGQELVLGTGNAHNWELRVPTDKIAHTP